MCKGKLLVGLSMLLLCNILPGFSQKTLWSIGQNDHSSAELALGPDRYKEFLAHDFGYEDRYFLVGFSDPKVSFPYALPGIDDVWGGTGGMAGFRNNDIHLLFGVQGEAKEAACKLIVRLTDAAEKNPPVLRISLNDKLIYKQVVKGKGDDRALQSTSPPEAGSVLEIPIEPGLIRIGGNELTFAIWEGSWVKFDNVELRTPETWSLLRPEELFIRKVEPAGYEIREAGKRFQPLLVDVERLTGRPRLSVNLDGKSIFSTLADTGRYVFEALMPACTRAKTSKYEVLVKGKVYERGEVKRSPQRIQTPADYVDTRMGSAHSRWMIAPGPWMPFGMVKLSPDNQNAGWQAGYQPTVESIGTFSHVHEWTMGGLGLFPTNGKLITRMGKEKDTEPGYRSRMDKASEKAPIGSYTVNLTDYGIQAELTATTRCGFQRYTYPQNKDSARVLVDFRIPAEYDYQLVDLQVKKVSDYRIEGYSHQLSEGVWGNDASQEYTLYFVLEFDRPIREMGGWLNGALLKSDLLEGKNLNAAGLYLQFDVSKNPVVQVRSGLSLVSLENASLNLKTEVADPFGWDFEAVRANQVKEWNKLLGRVEIKTSDRSEKERFYNSMYRSICSRNIFSDVNGEWRDAGEAIRRFNRPQDVALGCDAFWNTFWNLNQFWNLVLPEWSNKWVNSELAMYDANGWLAKGPAGMEYVPVMVAEHEIPLIVGAYQMGIRDFDAGKAFEAMKKMQNTPAQRVEGGFAGNRDLVPYLKYNYVPSDLGRFSNTLEYSYDNWTVAQFAKTLGKEQDYKTFLDRGAWWKNAINPETGYAQMRRSDGSFVTPFDSFKTGMNEQYVEGNAWQLTFFVPQDVPALASLIGKDRFVDRLEWGFEQSEPMRYNAPNDQYWDYPVVQGNQQSMHFAFLFNWVGKPWLTQRWSRSILDRYYGKGIGNAYLGDEDQGQMSAWLVMASLGLFQTDGGCRVNPVYEIASPLYEKAIIDLGQRYGRGKTFVLEAKNVSRTNKYVQSAILNGRPLRNFWFPASELLKGGSLILEMGDKPNTAWGVGSLPE